MAERSKAPDSSVNLLGVLVSHGGVGSNPTSDKILLLFVNSIACVKQQLKNAIYLTAGIINKCFEYIFALLTKISR